MNTLSESVQITIQFTKEAFKLLPEVTRKDYLSGTEQYRHLLGTREIKGNHIYILIHQVVDFIDYYKQTPHSLTNIRINEIFEMVRNASVFKGMELLGDIHTHPVFPGDCKPYQSWHPSNSDIESMISWYERDYLDPSIPYVYGIGGLLESLETGYNFYHLKKSADGYQNTEINWIEDK
jgi:hypothetical protein